MAFSLCGTTLRLKSRVNSQAAVVGAFGIFTRQVFGKQSLHMFLGYLGDRPFTSQNLTVLGRPVSPWSSPVMGRC